MDIVSFYNHIDKYVDGYKKLVSASKEIILRCPYCGDSNKRSNHGNFYIGERNGILFYDCKRASCGASGLVTSQILQDIGVNDLDIIAEVKKSILNSDFRPTNNKIIENINSFSLYDFEKMKPFYMNKYTYLQSRIYGDVDLSKYRIILSIKDFIDRYSLKLNKFQLSLIDSLEESAIGFLNSTGSSISFRYINDSFKYRYYKMRLNSLIDFYSLDTEIDLFNMNNLVINMCEGAFDIINIKHRLNKPDDQIYIAVNGDDYVNKLNHLVKMIGCINIDVNIYRDSDMPLNKLLKQFKYSFFKNDINIYSNIAGKDYSEKDLVINKDY